MKLGQPFCEVKLNQNKFLAFNLLLLELNLINFFSSDLLQEEKRHRARHSGVVSFVAHNLHELKSFDPEPQGVTLKAMLRCNSSKSPIDSLAIAMMFRREDLFNLAAIFGQVVKKLGFCGLAGHIKVHFKRIVACRPDQNPIDIKSVGHILLQAFEHFVVEDIVDVLVIRCH